MVSSFERERERENRVNNGAIPPFRILFSSVSPRMTTPLNDRPVSVGRSVGPKHPPHSLYRKALYPPCSRCAVPRRAMPCRAVPRCGTVCRAILSRVAWLVVSFLYSFVGKLAASLVFKRRQRGLGEWRAAERGKGKTKAKGKRRPASRGCEGDRREQDGSSVRSEYGANGERKAGRGAPRDALFVGKGK